MTWLGYACFSALFAGISTVLAKAGVRKTNSHLAAAIQSAAVFFFACVMVRLTGSSSSLAALGNRTIWQLLLSGLAAAVSLLCFFRGLQLGELCKIAPVAKCSTILTMLLSLWFLHDGLSSNEIIAIILILLGTILMVIRRDGERGKKSWGWLVYTLCAIVFLSISSVLAALVSEAVSSWLADAIRLAVALVVAWIVVLTTGGMSKIRSMVFLDGFFLILSGIAIGVSWICFHRACLFGQNTIVASIDRLSILVTVVSACVFLKERMPLRAVVGLVLLVCGLLLLLLQTPIWELRF